MSRLTCLGDKEVKREKMQIIESKNVRFKKEI